MGTLLILVGIFGFIFGVIRFIRSFFKKSPKKPELLIILGAFIVFVVGGILIEPAENKTAETKISSTQPTKIKNNSDSSSSEKKKNNKKKNEEKNTQKQALISFTDRVKQDNNNLANLEYSKNQTIEVNDNKPTFSEDDLSLANKAWEKYGDLDKLNRATSAEAMLNQSLMPTAKRGDISNVKPTGWHNKKIDKGYLYNRSHLIGYALSGENDNWKNLITGTAQLNNPEMLRYEMDIKTYLEKEKNNYVRYSVTPVFRGDELLARGVHMMAQSIGSNTIKFNIYIFNVQEGVTINYADGTSQTSKEKQEAQQKKEDEKKDQEQAAAEAKRQAQEQAAAEAKRQAQEQAAAEAKRQAQEQAAAEAKRQAQEQAAAEAKRQAQEQAAAEAQRQAQEQAAAEAQRQAQEQAATQQNQSGITGYCKDGSPASGDPSARGKANSCYGHGGWVR
ncbi:DNA/RNA non-specific endonuclease [Enterococcus hermanniensis]|uniref:DNA/RNA non-specific endonuclease n=1 Tax=Enterococcus hermanniensis TaxID=249189 RepID=UPI003611D5F4